MKTVLLVPVVGDPLGLIHPGPCKSQAPLATMGNHGWTFGEGLSTFWSSALVLAHEGKVVHEGVFRAWDQADDIAGEELMEALNATLPELVEQVGRWRRNGQPLGTIQVLS